MSNIWEFEPRRDGNGSGAYQRVVMNAATFEIRACAFTLALVASAIGCDAESGDDETWACRYDLSTYSISEYGTDFTESPDNCIEVSSPERCDEITETSNECHEGFCSEWTYTNVSVEPGSCADDFAAADGGDSPSDVSGCPWTY